MATSTEVKEQYSIAKRADQNGEFDTARAAYDAALEGYTNGPAGELALEGLEDWTGILSAAEFAALARRNWVFKVVDVRVQYATMNLRWSVQPDCPEYSHTRFDKAEQELHFAQASISDLLSYDSYLSPADQCKLHGEAGKIDNLLARLFTARGAMNTKLQAPADSVMRDYETAQRLYRSADRHFKRNYDHHPRILNAIYAARQERLLHSRLGARKWLGLVALELFREQQSYPEGARRSKRAVNGTRQDLQDYNTALAGVLRQP